MSRSAAPCPRVHLPPTLELDPAIDWAAVCRQIRALRQHGLSQEAILALFAIRGGCSDRQSLMDGLRVSESTAKRYEAQLRSFFSSQSVYERPETTLQCNVSSNAAETTLSREASLSQNPEPTGSPTVEGPGEEGEEGRPDPVQPVEYGRQDDRLVIRQLTARWPNVTDLLYKQWGGEYVFPWTRTAEHIMSGWGLSFIKDLPGVTQREIKIALTFAEMRARSICEPQALESGWLNWWPKLCQSAVREAGQALRRSGSGIKSPSRLFQSILYEYVDELERDPGLWRSIQSTPGIPVVRSVPTAVAGG